MKPDFLNTRAFKKYNQKKAYLELKGQIKEIAIYKGGGGLGDLVMSIPFFGIFKKAFPKAKISYMGIIYPRFEKIFRSIDNIDGYIHYERPNKGKGLKKHFAFRDKMKGKIDLLIDTQRRWETSFWLKHLQPKHMLTASPFLSDWPLPQMPYKKMHIFEQLLVLPARLGMQDFDKLSNKVDIPVEFKQNAKRFLDVPGQKIAAIIPSCGMQFKNWSPDYFAQLADMLSEDGYSIIILGSPSQIELLQEVQDKMQHKAIVPALVDISFSKQLLNDAAILEQCDIVVGNDSGGMHLASCLGSVSATIFGPTTPRKFSPVGPRNIIFYKQLSCSPCRFKCHRKIYRECLELITPQEVYEACQKFLETMSAKLKEA